MAGFEKLAEDYASAGVTLVALSADDEAGARKMRRDENLSFAVLYGLDVNVMERRLGIYVERGKRTHVQPAQFILDPHGTVKLACYSSGPVGRLSAREALDQVEALRD